MLAVSLSSENLISNYLQPLSLNDISIAAINTKDSITVAGPVDQIKKLSENLEQSKIFNRILKVSVPFHSPVTERIRDELLEKLKKLNPSFWSSEKPKFYSTALGKRLEEKETVNAEYWWKNVRNSVQFAKSIDSIIVEHSNALFIEIGPHAALQRYVESIHREAPFNIKSPCISSMLRDKSQFNTLVAAISQIWCLGGAISWSALGELSSACGQFIRLPFYQFNNLPYVVKYSEFLRQLLYGDSNLHPFLVKKIPNSSQVEYQTEISLRGRYKYLEGHKLGGTVIFPAAAYIEIGLALCALQSDTSIDNIHYPVGIESVELLQGLPLNENILLGVSFDKTSGRFSVHSCKDDDRFNWSARARGVVYSHLSLESALPEFARESLENIKNRISQGKVFPSKTLYDYLHYYHWSHTDYFHVCRDGWINGSEALVQIENKIPSGNYVFHPAAMDGYLQTVVTFALGSYIPIEVHDFKLLGPVPSSFYVYSKHLALKNSTLIKFSFVLYDLDGKVFAFVKKGVWGPNSLVSTNINVRNYYSWEEDTKFDKLKESELNQGGKWAVFPFATESDSSLETKIVEKLESFGITLLKAPEFTDSSIASIDGVLFICFPGIPPSDMKSILEMTRVLQVLMKKRNGKVKILLATFGSQTSNENTSIAGGAMIGFLRTAITEIPFFEFKMVDLEPAKKAKKYARILGYEMLPKDWVEDEVLWKSKKRYVHRIFNKETLPLVDPADNVVKLVAPKNLLLDSLQFRVGERSQNIGETEVEIAVKAVALNFKDVLKATGKLSAKITDETESKNLLGLECSGIISKVGSKVESKWKVGEKVSVASVGCFSSFVVVDQKYLLRMPESWSFAEAASFPVVFSTVWYCLAKVAHMEPGETILIHAASGGVGLAAIQIARLLGAGEIFATAGSDEKREYLRNIVGVKHVFSSRTTEFRQEILDITGGRGVDVIISAQPGEVLHASIKTLATSGRYCEIGKRDIEENTLLQMRPFNDNIIFAAIDMDRLAFTNKKKYQSILSDLQQLLDENKLTPIPVMTFSAENTSTAFKTLGRSKHIGKVVVEFNSPIPAVPFLPSIKPDKSYIIIGGMGGFGMETARWLIRHGAKYIMLVGRNPPNEQQIATIQNIGMHIDLRYTVGETKEIEYSHKLIRETNSWKQLGGIFHSAMVPSDHSIELQTKESFENNWNSKVLSVWNLHEASKSIKTIEYFVMYSSILAVLGTSGSSAYAAANSALDSIARYRKAHGLPALAVNWGGIADVGILTKKAHLLDSSIDKITSYDGLSALEDISPVDETVGIFQVDWNTAFKNRKWRPFFEKLAIVSVEEKSGTTQEEVVTKENLLESVLEFTASVLQVERQRLNGNSKLQHLGIDSLTGVELRGLIAKKFRIQTSIFDLLESENLSSLAATLFSKFEKDK